MAIHLTPCMRAAGITKRLLKTTKVIKCPRCNFGFNLMYSRAVACQGCHFSVLGCDSARCPKCDYEFPLNQTPLVATRTSSKLLANYMSNILTRYFRDFGKKPSR